MSNPSSRSNQPYQTPRRFPAMIQYLDDQFRQLNLWFDWMLLQSTGIFQVKRIQHHVGVTRTRAEKIIWNAFAAAFEADQNSPLFSEVHQLMQQVSPAEKPLFLAHTMIAVHIHRGMSVEEAKATFLKWLAEDPTHAIFGEFRLTPALTTVALGTEHRKDDPEE